jgi:hypothetical protein
VPLAPAPQESAGTLPVLRSISSPDDPPKLRRGPKRTHEAGPHIFNLTYDTLGQLAIYADDVSPRLTCTGGLTHTRRMTPTAL